MHQSGSDERRTCYRVRYPAGARPRLILDNRAFDVTELAEGGMRFLHRESIATETGEAVVGQVRFRDGSRTEICGTVLRGSHPGEAVVADLEGISMAKMMDEQRYLAKRFPGRGRG